MDRKRIIRTIIPWIIYGLVAIFIYLTVRDNLGELKQYRVDRPWFLLGAVVAFSLQFLSNAVIWGKLMRYVGETVSIWHSIYVYVSSFLVRYIPGNVWAVAARAVMNRTYGVSMTSSIWGWVIENISFLLVGLCLGLFVLTGFDAFSGEVVVVVVLVLPLCVLFLFRYALLERIVRFLVRRKLLGVVSDEISPFVISYMDRIKLVLLFLIPWMFFSAQFIFVILAIQDVAFSDLVFLVGVNSLAWSIGYISIVTPSGTGVREGLIILTLSVSGVVSEVDAVVIAILARMVTIVSEVLVFVIIKGIYIIKSNRKS